MRRTRPWFVVPIVLSGLATATPQASTVMQLNLGEMVQRADRIYRGTVLSVSAGTIPRAAVNSRSRSTSCASTRAFAATSPK